MSDEDFSDIDELMARLDDPEYLKNIPKIDLDRHIAYQRKQRAQREAGVRVKKPRSEAPPAISLTELLTGLKSSTPQKKPGSTMKRRF